MTCIYSIKYRAVDVTSLMKQNGSALTAVTVLGPMSQSTKVNELSVLP